MVGAGDASFFVRSCIEIMLLLNTVIQSISQIFFVNSVIYVKFFKCTGFEVVLYMNFKINNLVNTIQGEIVDNIDLFA
jgi:hypothetical protein